MRKAIGKTLRREFERRLLEGLPCFRPFPFKDNPLGERAYCCRAADDLAFYIVLRPHSRQETFCIEVGWSDGTPWPLPHEWWTDPGTPANGAGGWLSLGALWGAPNGMHEWQLSEHMSLDFSLTASPDEFVARLVDDGYVQTGVANVPAAVRDAVARVVEHAVPYFWRVAAERGRTFLTTPS